MPFLSSKTIKKPLYLADSTDEWIHQEETLKKQISDGTFTIFEGHIRVWAGSIKVSESTKLNVGDILSMNWYVEGVEGALPQHWPL